ncbi:hypothetical protein CMUST_14160 [Corynebacterium mustelae]|uniref:Uncharacterized protein n=2 Tax=Corynebacterium mustelae TaxID=571915 RepID=A0A0G3H320_9CORY|nr:hypothetical protein CMUST_14160 [Corynebacterium mustelae]
MNEQYYGNIVFFLGILPILVYSLSFSRRKKEQLLVNRFGGWYFIFESSFFTLCGLFPALLINAFFFADHMSLNRRFTFYFLLFVLMYFFIMFSMWIRLCGYRYKTRLRDFRPFMREIMGKNPYPDSDEAFPVGKANSTWLFKGCATLFFAIPVTIVVLILVLRSL